MATWQELPVELQQMIFTHLPVSSMAICCTVSKTWHHLTSDNQLWRHFYERDVVPFHDTNTTTLDPDNWKKEYQRYALTPAWDPKLSSAAFRFSQDDKMIRRNGGEGFFPKAISVLPLNMRHYRLEIIMKERGEVGLISRNPSEWMEGMADRGDFWYVIFDQMHNSRKASKIEMPECSFFGQYSTEAFTFSYLDGIYTPRNTTPRNQPSQDSVVGLEIDEDEVKWYENGQLRITTAAPQRPFHLVYCTPYADTETLIVYAAQPLESKEPAKYLASRLATYMPNIPDETSMGIIY